MKTQKNPLKAKKADNDNDIENEIDNDIVIENDTKIEIDIVIEVIKILRCSFSYTFVYE